MITMPYEEIIQTIIDKTGVSKQELEAKIKKKLDQLSGLISKDGAAHIVANELGIRLFDQLGGKLKIKDIHAGMREVETVGKIMRIWELKEFTTKTGMQGKVQSMLIGDETGTIRVVFWNDQADLSSKAQEGDIIRILGTMARSNLDRKELHLSAKSKVMLNPKGEKINIEIPMQGEAVRKTISELQGGEQDIEIKATIVQAFDIKFFEVCPQCGKRVLQKEEGFYCNTHEKVEPAFSNVMNIIGDDGSGNIRIVTFGATTTQLLGITSEKLLSFRDKPEEFDEIKNQLLGNILLLNGRVNKNEMFDRMDFVAKTVKQLDVASEIKKLKAEHKEEEKQEKAVKGEKPVKEEKQKTEPKPKAKPKAEEISDDITDDELSDFDIDEELI